VGLRGRHPSSFTGGWIRATGRARPRIRRVRPVPGAAGADPGRQLFGVRPGSARTRSERAARRRARDRRADRSPLSLARRGRSRAACIRCELDGLPGRDATRGAVARARWPDGALRSDGRSGEAGRAPSDLCGTARNRTRAGVSGRARRARRHRARRSATARRRPIRARGPDGGAVAVDRPADGRRARRARRVRQSGMGRTGSGAATPRPSRGRAGRAARRPLHEARPRRRHRP
jgi:hypothetical protein